MAIVVYDRVRRGVEEERPIVEAEFGILDCYFHTRLKWLLSGKGEVCKVAGSLLGRPPNAAVSSRISTRRRMLVLSRVLLLLGGVSCTAHKDGPSPSYLYEKDLHAWETMLATRQRWSNALSPAEGFEPFLGWHGKSSPGRGVDVRTLVCVCVCVCVWRAQDRVRTANAG